MGNDTRALTVDELASITVTFNPDLELLGRQLRSLDDVGMIVIVDNASDPELRQALRGLVTRMRQARLIENATNVGLAAALNQGVALARARSPRIAAVLLLDQDSTFRADVPSGLVNALNRVQAESGVPCCIGPTLVDPATGMTHGFHYVRNGWLWSRAHPSPDAQPFPAANLNGSGTTMSMDLVDRVGDLDASLFIDHVDTEWSFRVISHGFKLYGIPWLSFDHRMGQRGRRVWLLGWRVWPERSPRRHYYLYRNTVSLLRRPYVPLVWKFWAIVKAGLTLVVTMLGGPDRGNQWRMICKGLRDGLRGKHGH